MHLEEKAKILLVEEDTETRKLLKKLLIKNNLNVSDASNGEEALKKLKNHPIHIIVSNWTLPILNGLELCKIIKSDEKYKTIYFIMLTARASLKDRVTGLDAGADDFIIKPIDHQELLARIRTGIRIQNLQNEVKTMERAQALVYMACTIGHKLNNPLNSLALTVHNLKDELKGINKPQIQDDFRIIDKSIERMDKFVKDLIELEQPQYTDYLPGVSMIKLGD
jgi:sigma-B regulation protein RsbU (phosphoserine phosphatase)